MISKYFKYNNILLKIIEIVQKHNKNRPYINAMFSAF